MGGALNLQKSAVAPLAFPIWALALNEPQIALNDRQTFTNDLQITLNTLQVALNHLQITCRSS